MMSKFKVGRQSVRIWNHMAPFNKDLDTDYVNNKIESSAL